MSAFRFQPRKFFDWFRPLAAKIHKAQPNAAHYALAKLENAGHFAGVVTQNIDGLHQRAGSKQVFEIHGSLTRLVCTHCYTPFPSDKYIDPYLEHGEIPVCQECQHTLKPDVVLFEEQLPYEVWKNAESAVENADLLLVAGSSLQVMPAAKLPSLARKNGAPLILINKTPTYVDDFADIVLTGDVAEILPLIAQEVLIE